MTDEFLLQHIGGYSLCGRTLGKGAFARVELGIHRLTGNQVALKIINLNNVNEAYVRKNILRESAILKNLRHDHIVRLYETLAYKDSYCFVMEYLEGGDLQTHIREQKQKKLTEKQSRKFFTQLMLAIQYLHNNGIIHRDLKLQNIMLTDKKSKVKLVDFGLSNFFDKDHLLQTQCGSAEYAAPELFDRGVQYGPSVEVWSLGVVLFGMTTGRMPFEAQPTETKENLVVQIRRGMSISHESILKKVSPHLKNLFIRLLEPDKEKRITLHEMFSHPWVTEDGKNPLLTKPPPTFSHEVKQRVMAQVAQLYRQPVHNTMQEIRMNQQHAMVATYKILMDTAAKTNQPQPVKTRTHSAPCKYFKSNSMRKYEGGRVRPKSARPDRRSTSAMENKKDVRFHLVTCSQREKYEHYTSNNACRAAKYPSEVEPMSSCLKISKKPPMAKPPSPSSPRSPTPTSWDEQSDAGLQQTPIRMSVQPVKTVRCVKIQQTEQDYSEDEDDDEDYEDVVTAEMQRLTADLSCYDGVSYESQKADDFDSVQDDDGYSDDDQDSVTCGSRKIADRKIKIIMRKQETDDSGSIKIHSQKRCVSPSVARQMKHRDSFPLRKKSVEIRNPPATSRSFRYQDQYNTKNYSGTIIKPCRSYDTYIRPSSSTSSTSSSRKTQKTRTQKDFSTEETAQVPTCGVIGNATTGDGIISRAVNEHYNKLAGSKLVKTASRRRVSFKE